MSLLLYLLFSKSGLISFLVLFVSAILHFSFNFKTKGIVISVVMSFVFVIILFLASMVRNPNSMGWDFGLVTALCVFLALVIIFIGTLVPNIIRLPFSVQCIKEWYVERGKFPFFNSLPVLSLLLFSLLLTFKVVNYAFSILYSDAIWNNNKFIIKTCIHGSVLANKKLVYSPYFPLHLAALLGRDTIADHLLRNGANVNRENEIERTPIKEIMNQQMNDRLTPGHVACVSLLIDHGVFLDESIIIDIMGLPDHDSIIQSLYRRISRKIEEKHGSYNDFNSELSGFFTVALQEKYNNLLLSIFKKDNFINFIYDDGHSLLAEVFNAGNNEIATYLLDNGAQCPDNMQKENSFLPLHAIGKIDSSVASRYLDLCGTQYLDKLYYGTTALVSAAEEKNNAVLKLLLKMGANPDVHGEYYDTPLLTAAKHGNSEAIKLLCEAGADPNYQGTFGNALAVLCAQDTEFVEGAKMLISSGTSSVSQSSRGTPIHIAAEKGHNIIMELFLSMGVDVDIHDSSGCTPLMYACGNAQVEMVKLLLNHGADVHVRNNDGDTPVKVTERKSYNYRNDDDFNEVIKMLNSH